MELEDIIRVGDTLSFGTVTKIKWDGAHDMWDLEVQIPGMTLMTNTPSLRRVVIEALRPAKELSLQLMFCENDAEMPALIARVEPIERALNEVLAPLNLRATIGSGTTYFQSLA